MREITDTIEAVDAERCKTKISKEKRTSGRTFYSPKALNASFKELFGARGWEQSRTTYWVTKNPKLVRTTMAMPPDKQRRVIEASGEKAIMSWNQTDFVKERVAVEVQFGKYSFVAYDLFVKHLAFFIGEIIDVGVEILPMKELSSQMSSGVAYYEGEPYNVLRQGRGTPPVPLIIFGVAP